MNKLIIAYQKYLLYALLLLSISTYAQLNDSTLNEVEFPIFGEKHAAVSIIDNKLKGCVFYMVSGHGGPDPGAIGKCGNYNLCEDEYAYDITLRLARNLLSHDAVSYMIVRDDNDGIRSENYLKSDNDETCWKNKPIPLNQKKRLKQRSKIVNTLYRSRKKDIRQFVIMLHIDSRSTKKRVDMFFYYNKKSTSGKLLAKTLQETIRKKYDKHQKNRGYSGTVEYRDLHMLRETIPTSVYIELGNIMNSKDQKRFILEENRQAVADWLTEGILTYINNTK